MQWVSSECGLEPDMREQIRWVSDYEVRSERGAYGGVNVGPFWAWKVT